MFRKVFCLIIVLLITAAVTLSGAPDNVHELQIGTPVSGNLTQAEGHRWYSVRTTNAGVLTVQTSGRFNKFLEAYDSQQNLLSENNVRADGRNARVTIFVNANTTYLFKLSGISPAFIGQFVLSADFRPIQELRFGTPLSGTLERDQRDIWYRVRAANAGILIVQTTGTIDTYLEIYDNSRQNLIAEDDDSGERLNAKVELFVEPNDTFYIFLRGARDSTNGQFGILAEFNTIPELRAGSHILVNLERGHHIWYCVRTADAGALTIETIGNINTVLRAYDSQRNFILEKSDGGHGRNAKIEISVDANSTYYIKLLGAFSNTAGQFGVFTRFNSIQGLVSGVSLAGNLEQGNTNTYSVRSATAGTFIIETTGRTDTFLEAYDSQQNLIAEDDDSGSGTNARIEILAEANTTYTIRLRGESSSTAGLYEISSIFRPAPVLTELRIGASLSGNLEREQHDWYTVRSPNAGIITVQTTGSTDTFLQAYDSRQNLITEDDNSGEGRNARIEILAEANTVYTVKLLGAARAAAGAYGISASFTATNAIPELRIGRSLSGNLQSGQNIWYRVRSSNAGLLAIETTGISNAFLRAFDDQINFIDGHSSRLEIPVGANSNYFIKLHGATGSFGISASFRAVNAIPELRVGQPQGGTLQQDQVIWYRVRSANAGIITVFTDGDTDTFLRAYDDQQNFIRANDDGAFPEFPNNYNAAVEFFARANTNYFIKLTHGGKGRPDRFQLHTEFLAMNSIPELRLGVSFNRTLEADDVQWLRINANRNGFLNVINRNPAASIIARLNKYMYNSNASRLTSDFGSDIYSTTRLGIGVRTGNTYIILIEGRTPSLRGAYGISASINNLPSPTQLNIGNPHSGRLSGSRQWFSVRTPRRGTLVIETTGNANTYLEVYNDSFEQVLAYDENSGSGRNARIRLPVEANRTYNIKLRGVNYTDIGPYVLTTRME